MINQNKSKNLEEFTRLSKAPLEHLFGNHEYCNVKWCQKLQADAEKKNIHTS